MEIFIWLFGIAVVVIVITNVYWILAWAWPTMSTNARDFIRAKKKRMPLIILDDGKRFTFHVAKKFFEDAVETEDEGFISLWPNSIKYAKGLLMAIGEGHRGITVTPESMAEVNKLARAGYRVSDVMNSIKGVKNVAEEKQGQGPVGIRTEGTDGEIRGSDTDTAGPIRGLPPAERIDEKNEFEIDWTNG